MYKGKLYLKILVAGIFLSILVLLSNGCGTEVILEQKKNNLGPVDFNYNVEKPLFLDLMPSEPIEISSDGDFISLGFNGSGTAGDPYIIEGYYISTTDHNGISIGSISKYFVIRNCYVSADQMGIRLVNVANEIASIINNTCTNNYYGIYVSSSSGSTLTNNTCTNNYYGICLSSSSGSTFTNNTCTNNDGTGIYLSSSSSDLTLIDNICTNNDGNGISLELSSIATLTSNNCSYNLGHGINLLYFDSCFINLNLLQQNHKYGINIGYYSDNNLIHHNTFIDNNLDGDSQANDIGKKNNWYNTETKEGNYWSNLGTECTYIIDGEAHSKDLYPLNRALDCLNPIVISTISIVLPILGSVVILAFVVPRYVIPYTRKTLIPYFRKRRAEKQLRRAKILSCPKCGKSIKTSTTSCENCGTIIPKRKLFADLRLKTAESKMNRVIIMAYLGMMLLAIPVVILWYSFSLYDGYGSYAWMFYLMFFIAPGIPLAIIILLILFKAKIARMKLWAKLSLLCSIILVLAGIIYGGFIGWFLTFHFA